MHQWQNCFLAHERLAIIDPASGDQPLYNEDKSIVVAVNGARGAGLTSPVHKRAALDGGPAGRLRAQLRGRLHSCGAGVAWCPQRSVAGQSSSKQLLGLCGMSGWPWGNH